MNDNESIADSVETETVNSDHDQMEEDRISETSSEEMGESSSEEEEEDSEDEEEEETEKPEEYDCWAHLVFQVVNDLRLGGILEKKHTSIIEQAETIEDLYKPETLKAMTKCLMQEAIYFMHLVRKLKKDPVLQRILERKEALKNIYETNFDKTEITEMAWEKSEHVLQKILEKESCRQELKKLFEDEDSSDSD